ncbi:MAG TPA: hypothetical protein VHK67_01705 [Rhabdochlamydiaceae bacterium]|jgi:hypothetical protein|nr:hypothetical protein [Rhabdochlamydiaceae bacterium]
MAAMTSSTTISPTIFKELSSTVTAFIAEIDAKENNGPNSIVTTATQLLIAIENAANIFKECTPDRQAALAARAEEFKQMIACLKKTDYCRLNLPTLIRHSIDIGTSDGSIPKLYAVNPQYIVPKAETTVQFFGKFKYADQAKHGKTYLPALQVGGKAFEPTQCDHHVLTFKITFDSKNTPFKKDKSSQFDGRLIVPYEVGHLGMVYAQKKAFEFNVSIRALPTCAGVVIITAEMINDQVVKMEWGENRTFTLDSKMNSKLTFISFDTQKQEFTAAQLETEAKKALPYSLIIERSYLKISQVAPYGDDKYKWQVETIPPVGL